MSSHIDFNGIREEARAMEEQTADLLSRMVKVPSYSGEEGQYQPFMEELCRTIGFDEVSIDGLGNVVARLGKGPKIIAFDAHIDTVTIGDRAQWDNDPFSGTVENGKVHGRGSVDQKGGAAAMLSAARIMKERGLPESLSVYFTFTIMEEDCDGMCWKYLIEEEKLVPDFYVSTEPSSCRICRGHRGRMEMEVFIKGVSCHGSAPERGVSAAYKAARAALAVEQLNKNLKPDADNFLGKGTITVSEIEVKGPSQCAVPDQARLYLDRRLTWGETKEQAVREVEEAIGDFEKVTVPFYDKTSWKGTAYGQELYFPTWKIDEDHLLVQSAAGAYAGLFQEKPSVGRWTFSTNAVSVCGRHQIPSIGFGPGDENQAHAPNENNRTEDLVRCTAFYAALPYTLAEKLS